MNGILDGMMKGQMMDAQNRAFNAEQDKNQAIENANDWKKYAYELEELVIELGSRLEATTILVEQILRAANGEPVEHADKLLAADETGEAARLAMLTEIQKISKTGMAQAHKDRLKVNPNANRKKVAIDKTYSPKSERMSKLWNNFIKIRTSRGDGPPTPADAIKMRELLLEIAPELIAANNLTLRLLAEGNGQQVPEKLLPAEQYDARKDYLEAQMKNSRDGMINAGIEEIKSMVSMSEPESTVARQQKKIARRERGKKL